MSKGSPSSEFGEARRGISLIAGGYIMLGIESDGERPGITVLALSLLGGS